MNTHRIKRARQWCMPFCLTLFFFILLRFVILVGYVPSGSMEPAIPQGSVIVGYRLYHKLDRGDVVVFRKDGKLQVKRIQGLPGDIICWDNLHYIPNYPRPARPTETTEVPEGCYFLLGDNTANSFDSRYWADPFVPESEIIARIGN